jgi:hypothetical protein
MKTFAAALTLLALCALSVVGQGQTVDVNPQPQSAGPVDAHAGRAAPISDAATATCAVTFTSGVSDDFLKSCVTVNGNVAQFEAPLGHEHIRHGIVGEGYGVCDVNTNTEYFDYSLFGDSPNWGASTLGTQTATSVKIARTTIDGVWTLTQTFTQVAGTSPLVKLTMSLRNNTAIDRTVFLMRYADVEPDHLFTSSMGATSNSAFAFNQTVVGNVGLRGNFGLILQGAALPQQHSPDLGPQGFIEDNAFSDPPPPCTPYRNFVTGTPAESKGSLVVIYQLGVPARSAKAVTVTYKGL